MNAYAKEFTTAIKTTKDLGLAPGKITKNSKYALSGEMADFIQDEISLIGTILGSGNDVRKNQCMMITSYITDRLRENFKCLPIVTIGYVTIDEKDCFKFDLEYIKHELCKGPDTADQPIHCWITFPSEPYFELLDLTLTSTFEIGSPAGTPVRVSGWFQPEGLFYHPILVGKGFIQRTSLGPERALKGLGL